MVLKRLNDAIADRDHVVAVIKGSAINNDGSLKVGFTAPGIHGQTRVLREALGVARVEPDTICYIECHGTGTVLGDPNELEALAAVYGRDRAPQSQVFRRCLALDSSRPQGRGRKKRALGRELRLALRWTRSRDREGRERDRGFHLSRRLSVILAAAHPEERRGKERRTQERSP